MSDSEKKSDRFKMGMATRRAVLGGAHVDRATAAMTDFDEPFQTFITEGAWGSVWSRPQLTHRERSLVTIALLTRATTNTGATPEDVREALLHVAVYAGVPAANHAFKIVKKAYAEMNEASKGGDGPRG
jgi:4-carboxymuconolactone decarboxylase